MTILLSSCNRGDIAFGRVEAVLAGHHLAPFRLKRNDLLKQLSAKSPWQNTMLGLPCVELFISNLLDQALSRIAEGTASRDGVIGNPHFEGRRLLARISDLVVVTKARARSSGSRADVLRSRAVRLRVAA